MGANYAALALSAFFFGLRAVPAFWEQLALVHAAGLFNFDQTYRPAK